MNESKDTEKDEILNEMFKHRNIISHNYLELKEKEMILQKIKVFYLSIILIAQIVIAVGVWYV